MSNFGSLLTFALPTEKIIVKINSRGKYRMTKGQSNCSRQIPWFRIM